MFNLGLTRDYPEEANRYNLVDLVLHDSMNLLKVQIEKKKYEKPKPTSGTKTEKTLAFFMKTENQMLKHEKSANRIEHQNRKTEVF